MNNESRLCIKHWNNDRERLIALFSILPDTCPISIIKKNVINDENFGSLQSVLKTQEPQSNPDMARSRSMNSIFESIWTK